MDPGLSSPLGEGTEMNQSGVTNLSRRVRKLESQLTNGTGWWPAQTNGSRSGERRSSDSSRRAPERIGRISVEVIDQMREQPCIRGTAVAGVLTD